MKKPLFLIFFIITIIIGLAVVQVVVSNKLSTAGIELENLQSKVDAYRKENINLDEKVLEASSLQNLSKKARAIGFVQAKSQIYLTNPVPLALKNF